MAGLVALDGVNLHPSHAGAAKFDCASAAAFDPHVEQSSLTPATLDCWVAMDGRARLVLDAFGRVLECGPGTRLALTKSRDFDIVSDQLLPTDRRYHDRFRGLLDATTSEMRTAVIPMNEREGHWICRALAFDTGIQTRLLGLTMQQATDDHAPEWINFRDVLDLTHTESQILNECLCGRTPQAIAAGHHLSINTVRTHFRHIYDKLGVSNTQDLQRKLSGYRIL